MKNINFIFKMLDKKKLFLYMSLDAFLDIIYYVVPFTFTFLLTMPFTLKKGMIVATVFIISKTLRCIGNYVLSKMSGNYFYAYSKVQYLEYYKKVSKLPTETLSKYQTGYLQSIIEKVINLVNDLLQTEYVSIILGFFFFFYTVNTQSFLLFIISILLSIACVVLSVVILKKSNKQVEKLYDEEYEESSIYQDYISNIRTVKSLNNNHYFESNIKEKGQTCYKEHKKYVNNYSLEALIRNTFIIIPFILAMIKAVIDLSHGIDTLGIIAFYISIQVEMGYIFDELSSNIINWFELKAITKKLKVLFQELDNRPIIDDFEKIKLKNVCIQYPESNINIKINDLTIHKNDKISITGKSGQGKTSLLNLILGNISSYQGSMMIDQYNANEIKLDIGVVSQEIELFNTSIKENLCLGKDISNETLAAYLKELQLNEILLFENGMNTIVGEKGLKLSTGQKRRLNILRSYLMDKKIYVLDEPTSNLDLQTEKIVVDFILKHFKSKTLIISTHNKEINKICNQFYQFENHELKSNEKNQL